MKPATKALIVFGGYIAAALIAGLTTGAYVADTPTVDRSGGMSAFGDSVFFLAAFAVLAVPSTAALLYFMRPYPWFWTLLKLKGYFIFAVTIAACMTYAVRADPKGQSLFMMVAPLWLLAAPAFAGAFFLAGLFGPTLQVRKPLFIVSALHVMVFACAVLMVILSR